MGTRPVGAVAAASSSDPDVDVDAVRPSNLAALTLFAAQASDQLDGASAQQIVEWTRQRFGTRLAVATSMADGVLTHLVSRQIPGIDVLFLDTGYHFAETLGTRDAVASVSDARVWSALPLLSVAQQDARFGPRLYERDPDACCRMRKVEPLDKALHGVDAWFSGVRREEAPSRADTPVVGVDGRRGKLRVHPLVAWTQADVDAYVERHGVLVNPLVEEGYASIGCAPCTRRVALGADPRSGRWAGSAKTECGLNE